MYTLFAHAGHDHPEEHVAATVSEQAALGSAVVVVVVLVAVLTVGMALLARREAKTKAKATPKKK